MSNKWALFSRIVLLKSSKNETKTTKKKQKHVK